MSVPVPHLVAALREVFRTVGSPGESVPARRIPPVPLASEPPEGWRSYECNAGPYTRFTVRYPRRWHALAPQSGDPVHLQPDPRSQLDVAVTITTHPEPIQGPQGILDAVTEAAVVRGVDCERSQVQLDRWEDDGWAGSWAWSERSAAGCLRGWWLLVIGHDQGTIFVMATGDRAQLEDCSAEVEGIVASLRLPPSDLLAPEFFPHALCQLLNDRRFGGEQPWGFNDKGQLQSGALVVRLWDIYRAYLHTGDLEAVAGALDAQSRDRLERSWTGRDWEEVRSKLRVVLRRRDTVRGLPVVQVPLSDDLVACPVLDSGDQMVFIPTEESERWGLDPRDLLTNAVASLDQGGPATLVEVRDDVDGSLRAFQIADGDGYDSGRLLCPRVRSTIEEALGGPLIVAIPAAGLVLVARDDEETRLDLAEAVDLGFNRRPRPLSDGLWRWTEAGLEPLNG